MINAMNNYAVQNVMLKFFECKKQEVESGNLSEDEQFNIDLSILGDLIVNFRGSKNLITSINKVNFEQLEKTVEVAKEEFEKKLKSMNIEESDEIDDYLYVYITKMKEMQRKKSVENTEFVDEFLCDQMVKDKNNMLVSKNKAIKSGEELEILNAFVSSFDEMIVDFCLRQGELRNEFNDQNINNNVR